MSSIRIRTTSANERTLEQPAVDGLAAQVRGRVLTAGSPGYDAARTIWNAMIDRRPALVAQCLSAVDVMRAVAFAREHRLLTSIRSGGHNIAGSAVCDGGFMIDLSHMKSVRVDAARRTAWVEPGCTLADFDHDAQAFGLATPLGINSTTGVAGLTLGGGFGWLSRKFGMTVDNLLSVDVVTADAKLIRASSQENPDLFWGLRGGGGNLGVVTSFEFQLHPVGPEVLSGLIVHPLDSAKAVLRHYGDFAKQTSDDVACWAVLRKAPPLPFLPANVHGTEVVIIAVCCAGDMKAGERELEPLRRFGRPIADVIGPHPFTGWQKAFDPLLTPGVRNYWKSHNIVHLDDALIEALVDFTRRLPSPLTEIFLGQIGGQARRVPVDATAYAQRDTEWAMNVHARWENPADDEKCVRWARDMIAATAKYATGGVYVNFLTEDESGRVESAYGPNYARLAALKAKYDPDNLFRVNQNVRPAVSV